MDYSVTFEHVRLREGRAAEIGFDHHARGSTVSFNTNLGPNCAAPASQFNPSLHGKHEAIHLFLSRLSSLAFSRFCLERELYDAEEGMVRVLEKVLERKTDK